MPKTPGKQVFNKTYFHTEALDLLSSAQSQKVFRAAKIANLELGTEFNVVRLEEGSTRIALLLYHDFFGEPFPELRESWLVDVTSGQVSYRSYEQSLNPPILHRKELLLPPNHSRWNEYAALTISTEELGLYNHPNRIGYRSQWTHLIRDCGYSIVGHQLIPIANDESNTQNEDEKNSSGFIERHRTALTRHTFSAPVQSLARNGYLDGGNTFFDYGCGRGDDLRGLLESGVKASGWDPHFAPLQPIQAADIVNLGFVVNVIEDFDERVEVVGRAYSLAERLLVISVMLANDYCTVGQPMNDGVVTKRRTFQKYYSQAEIIAFVKAVLDEEPIPVSPGVLYVYRDKNWEQQFYENRNKSKRAFQRTGFSGNKPAHISHRTISIQEKYTKYKKSLESLWDTCLALGRMPHPTETRMLPDLIGGFGSLPKATRFIINQKGQGLLEQSRQRRTDDLCVVLALQQFEGKNTYKHLNPGLKRDIKSFFGTVKAASEAARDLLFRIADTDAIAQACQWANNHGLGHYEIGKSLQLHTSLVEQLPSLLRVYVGSAAALYGDYRNADLVKIHVTSGTLTLLRFDDFESRPMPRLAERVKLKLREQNIEYYDFAQNSFEAPYLYSKSKYINEEYPNFPEQLAFEQQLEALPFVKLSGYGPKSTTFDSLLQSHRWCIEDFQLKRIETIPSLDTQCGKYFSYRNLIECGETQSVTKIPNIPRNPDSYSALLDLTTNILDPVIDYFGMIQLTYGFCSAELEKAIRGRISPKLDQHAAHEKRRNGHYICKRLGAAVDFFVEYEDMEEVAEWIAQYTPFDRLYFYGKKKPLHVSYGPEQSRIFVQMHISQNGHLIPRPYRLSDKQYS